MRTVIPEWVRRVGGGTLAAIGVALLGGCIGAPGIPAGPLQGTGVALSGAYGYAVAPARITMRSTVDGRHDSYVDPAGDAANFPLLPSRLGGRVGISQWFDAAGDLSALDSGFEMRVGLPEGTRPFPMALSLGVRRGRWGVLALENRTSSEQRLRFEAYPRLVELPRVRVNLISTLGLSTGRRFHPSQLPPRFAREGLDEVNGSESEGYPQLANFDPYILRDETRLEGSAGFELRQQRFFASLVLMPYVVTGSGHPLSVCRDCGDWEVQRFHSNFGAALFVSFGVSFARERHD